MRKLMLFAGIVMSAISMNVGANWYLGVNANTTAVDYQTSLYDNSMGDPNGAGLTVGYQATPAMAVELTHNDLGTANGLGGLLEYKAKSTALWAVFRQPLRLGSYHFYGNSRVGLASVDGQASIAGTPVAWGNEINPAIGLGLQLPIASGAWSVTADARATQAQVELFGSDTEFEESLVTYTVGLRRDF